MRKTVEVDLDDFQVKLHLDRGHLAIRLVLQGEKAEELLRKNRFKNPFKDYRRKLYLMVKSGESQQKHRGAYAVTMPPEAEFDSERGDGSSQQEDRGAGAAGRR